MLQVKFPENSIYFILLFEDQFQDEKSLLIPFWDGTEFWLKSKSGYSKKSTITDPEGKKIDLKLFFFMLNVINRCILCIESLSSQVPSLWKQ
jgi:hypothetical protein